MRPLARSTLVNACYLNLGGPMHYVGLDLHLAGAAKEGRLPFVRRPTTVDRKSLRRDRGLSARSSSAVR